MDLRSYCRLLVRRWRILLLVCLVVGAGLVGAGFLIPTTYTAHARMVFVPKLSPYASLPARQVAETYLADRMTTYAQVVTTNQVLQPVIDSLDLGVTVPELIEQIEVTIPSNTLVIDLAVKAPTAADAASIANRITNEMSWAIADLEGAPSVAESPVQVAVLQPADIPAHRSSPNMLLNLAVAVGVALIAGVFAAVLADNFDTRIRRRSDVTASGVPYLGGVPTARNVKARGLLPFTEQPPELRAILHRIAFDVLCSVEDSPNLIFTSPRTGAGKTLLAANVAGALAAAGKRVAFIDADVRKTRLSALVGMTQTRGVADFAVARMRLDQSLLQDNWGGFTVIPCGGNGIDVGEILAGGEFAELVRYLADHFDVVIVDAPPIASFGDAARFTKHISNVVIVAAAGSTPRAELLRVTGSLRRARANVLGVVLSEARADEEPAPADENGEETSDR